MNPNRTNKTKLQNEQEYAIFKSKKSSFNKSRIFIAALSVVILGLTFTVSQKAIEKENQLSTTLVVTVVSKENTCVSETEKSEQSDADNITEISVENNAKIVYITPTGKKYHIRATCAGKNAIEINLDEAKQKYEPCKKCVH